MSNPTSVPRDELAWKSTGFERLRRAADHQPAGIRCGLRHDPAIRQVSIAVAFLVAVACVLPVSRVERLPLILPVMQVGVFEYLNSAIEACVDRISLEPHPLSRQAKDYASVAVAGTVLMAGVDRPLPDACVPEVDQPRPGPGALQLRLVARSQCA
jgi:diacylglycerol kinase (ATP)